MKDSDTKMIQAIVGDTEEQRHSCKPLTYGNVSSAAAAAAADHFANPLEGIHLCAAFPAILTHSKHHLQRFTTVEGSTVDRCHSCTFYTKGFTFT